MAVRTAAHGRREAWTAIQKIRHGMSTRLRAG
ncbi:Uncharacterised protein [Nocardia otitidiscaviarum]|uniref:Uncharacterized protein n=1 Tax=Nocardia otitidiscaviarum TaxID=1823 RepID=A0A378YT13_9NOCA|nr:Uncharacterised protein [Nocardia otitidiscaviarum]